MQTLFLEELAQQKRSELLLTAERRRLATEAPRPALRSFPRLRRAVGRRLISLGDRIASEPCPKDRRLRAV